MVKLLQCQSTVSHPTHMWVDGGDNYHYFGDKHLFNILFVRPTYVHVTVISTFSDSGVVLVPVNFPGSHTLHSLSPEYWNPTYLTNILSLISLKFYSGFLGACHETLSSCTFHNSQGFNFTIKTTRKKTLTT